MFTFEGGVNDVYPQLIHSILNDGEESHPRGTHTREIHPAFIELDPSKGKLVTSTGRPINLAFSLAEILWIIAGRRDVSGLVPFNSNIANFSDDGIIFNAPYGYRLRTEHGFDQIEDVIHTLLDDRDTRQATMTIWSEADRGWNEDGTKRVTKDRACNLLSRLMIRGGALDWMQVMRSNDAIWGTPYNWMQFMHLQEWMAGKVGVPVGNYWHVVDSLHVYENTYYKISDMNEVLPYDLYSAFGESDVPMGDFSHADAHTALYRSARYGGYDPIHTGNQWLDDVGWVLAAHRRYSAHMDVRAIDALAHVSNQVWAFSQFRFYMEHRWGKEPEIYKKIFEAFDDLYKSHPTVARWIGDSIVQ